MGTASTAQGQGQGLTTLRGTVLAGGEMAMPDPLEDRAHGGPTDLDLPCFLPL